MVIGATGSSFQTVMAQCRPPLSYLHKGRMTPKEAGDAPNQTLLQKRLVGL